MPVPEAQLDTWSRQGAVVTSASTYDAVRRALTAPDAPFKDREFEIFLQGSYGNDTNIYADSDVDIVIRLTSTYYEDIDGLSAADRIQHDGDWSPASYQFEDFKREVAAWLTRNFGNGVDASGKAIRVPAGQGRRDADVLACAEFRNYNSYTYRFSADYDAGLCFWTAQGARIENYPKQHMAACTEKHQRTHGWFKPVVRIIKNLRNAMVQQGAIPAGLAPSYFIEGMLTNVPDGLFGKSYQDSVAAAVNWLGAADPTTLTCANGLHWLLRDGPPVCWRRASFDAFLAAVVQYWNDA